MAENDMTGRCQGTLRATFPAWGAAALTTAAVTAMVALTPAAAQPVPLPQPAPLPRTGTMPPPPQRTAPTAAPAAPAAPAARNTSPSWFPSLPSIFGGKKEEAAPAPQQPAGTSI